MGIRVAFISVCYSLLLNLFVLTNQQLQEYYFIIIRITTLIELCLYSFLFYQIIISVSFRRFIVITTTLCSLYFLYSAWSGKNGFDSESSAISFLVIMGYCIFYLYERVKDTQDPFFYSSPTFLVIVSIIVYSAGTFFPFIFARYYLDGDIFVTEFDLIHDTLYVIKNIILCFAILAQNKIDPKPKHKNQNKLSFNPR